MRILFIIDGLRKGGKERRFLELIKEIDKIDEIEYKIILFHQDIHFELSKNIKKKIVFVQKQSKKSITPFIQIYKIAKSFRPDIIHTWSFMVTVYTLYSMLLLKNVVLINSQISDAPIKIAPFTYFLSKLNFLFSKYVLANSQAGLASYQVPKSKAKCIHNGFAASRLKTHRSTNEIRSAFRITSTFVVSMIASFSSSKDYKTYLNAAQKILQLRNDITFLCVGGGEELTEFQNQYHINVYPEIRFLGQLDNVEEIVSISDVGVLATFTEGISNSILEFQAFGVPVVATRCMGNMEIIEHGMNGFLCEPEDVDSLAKYILNLILEPDLKRIMSENAIRVVQSKFSITNMVEENIAIYKTALKNN
ncbi:MAG: glycosyltransferase [Bacteroidales bacterium]|jgi:glycosyltransferase involved in cell wall biosynthesis|nr:glycosyltransferase [Bacteroidales bacterium]